MLTHVTMQDFREAGIAEAYRMEEYTDLSSNLLGEAMNAANAFISIYTSTVEAVTIEDELDMLYAFTRGFLDGARHTALRPAHPSIQCVEPEEGTMTVRGRNAQADDSIARKLLTW